MKAHFSHKAIRKTLSAWFVLWLSGAVFLFCCEIPADGAETAHNSRSANAGHCHKQAAQAGGERKTARQWALQGWSRAFACDVLTSVFDRARKIEKTPQTPEIAPVIKIAPHAFASEKPDFYSPKIYRPAVINRRGAYLKNRVFRI